MKRWLLLVLAVSTLLWAACGAKPNTPGEVCGDAGCDACIGLNCPDAGTP